MKKYLYLFGIIVLSFIITFSNKTYAYEPCYYQKIKLNNLNTNNFTKYINEQNPKTKYLKICSYENCYEVRNENITTALNNFVKIQKKKNSEEYNLEIEIKGFPITEIIVNQCE